jgi:hypothetical protein
MARMTDQSRTGGALWPAPAQDLMQLARELYLVPPARFTATRDDLVRKARASGAFELAADLQRLRRPTLSAWLINLVIDHERSAIDELSALGRQLREAQKVADGARLRELAARRQQLVRRLVKDAEQLAIGAGGQPTARALAEVRATLLAMLVDLAATSTVRSGRLDRPSSHAGFGPLPDPQPTPEAAAELAEPLPGSADDPTPLPGPADDQRDGWLFWPVDETAPPVMPEPAHDHSERRSLRLVYSADAAPPPGGTEHQLSVAESAHWRRERDLDAAEAALAAAHDELSWFDQQRHTARQEKADAERRLAEAKSAQLAAIHAVREARRALDAEREHQPDPV